MTATVRDLGLYLHIPFCRQRCHFCAFYLEIARAERIEAFCVAMAQEFALYRQHHVLAGRPLTTIYFGGGTPTAIPTHKLIDLLDLVRDTWPVSSTAEITVEAHPSTVTAGDVRALHSGGFNRISFGAETMNREDFPAIGRPGSVRDTVAAVAAAKAAGFTNINLDLMYGLPGQTVESWTATLREVLALEPSHVSCYALTIEQGTKLAHEVARHLVLAPDDSLQVEMEATAEGILHEAGFRRYELSNYAKPGWACRHNLLYWTDQDYLGLGPSAQSYLDGVRFGELADLTAYIDCLAQGRLPVEGHRPLSRAEQQRDAVVFGLRLIEGVSRRTIDGPSTSSQSRRTLDRLIARGLLEEDRERVRLTKLGQRYADTVAEELF